MMTLRYLFLLLVFTMSVGQAQNKFTENWEGLYKGDLELYGVHDVKMTLKMELDIKKQSDSLYQWKITYDYNGKIDVRNYSIKCIDAQKGTYVIDENNGILIDAYFKNKTLNSYFEVQDFAILTSYEKTADDLITFDLFSMDTKKYRVSGGNKHDEQEIPEIKSLLVNGRQKALLYKQN